MTIQPFSPPFLECPRGRRRFGDQIAFAAGGTWEQEVPTDAIIEQLVLQLDLTVTIGSSPSGYVVYAFNMARMLSTIQLEIGALGIKKSMTGLSAWLLAGLRHQEMPHIDSLTTAESNAAAAYACSVEIPLDLASFGVAPPDIGALVAKSHNQIKLRGTFGTFAADMAHSGSGGTAALAGTLKFYRHNVFPQLYDAGGYGHLVENYQTKAISTAAQHEFKLTPFRRHRSVLILCEAGTAPAVDLSDAVLTQAQVRVEASVFPIDLYDEQVRRAMHRNGAPDTFADGVAMPWTGIYWLEYGKIMAGLPGSVHAYLDAGEASEVTLLLDLLAPTGANVEVHQSFWED